MKKSAILKFVRKKRVQLTIFLAIFILFAISTLLFYPSTETLTDKTFLGAHRGNSVDYIENTLPAFEDALQDEKYAFIEFDVQYTKDNVIVVHHDLSLARLQKRLDRIDALTYEELLQKSSYHIPTYGEVIELLAGEKPLNIEIKSQGDINDDLELANFIIADLQDRGILDTTLISSISFDLIEILNNIYNNRIGYSQYSDYWAKQDRILDTGLIFYVDESTFTRRIPIIRFISEQLRDNGTLNSMISSWWLSGANHLMIHGANIRQYNTLRPEIPFNSKVVLWTFDDKMYLVLPDKEIWDWQAYFGYEIDRVDPWWID